MHEYQPKRISWFKWTEEKKSILEKRVHFIWNKTSPKPLQELPATIEHICKGTTFGNKEHIKQQPKPTLVQQYTKKQHIRLLIFSLHHEVSKKASKTSYHILLKKTTAAHSWAQQRYKNSQRQIMKGLAMECTTYDRFIPYLEAQLVSISPILYNNQSYRHYEYKIKQLTWLVLIRYKWKPVSPPTNHREIKQ